MTDFSIEQEIKDSITLSEAQEYVRTHMIEDITDLGMYQRCFDIVRKSANWLTMASVVGNPQAHAVIKNFNV
jgi:hypothetical protein